MPSILYNNTSILLSDAQTVLEALEEAGFNIPYSCRSGICHSCMMQSEQKPPLAAQEGLNENQKAQHFFLACSCLPEQDMQVALIGDTEKQAARIIEKKRLNSSVMALLVQTEFRWYPGQYITLWYNNENDEQGRAYSIANRCEQNKTLELHVKRHKQGLVSRWLHDEVQIGDLIKVSKPQGECFYSDAHHDKPLLLAGTGTGLAPLMGILKEALAQNHSAPIYLYAAAGEPAALYYRDELQAIAEANDNVHYIPTVRRGGEGDAALVEEDLVDLVKQRHPDLKGWKIFLCGNEAMIKQLQRDCFFKGAGVGDIFVDAFVINNKQGEAVKR